MEVVAGETISEGLVNALIERLQTGDQNRMVVTLLVIAAIVIPMAIMLYKSTPPGALKERLGAEVNAGATAMLNGLRTAAKLTPIDFDDALVDYLAKKVNERLPGSGQPPTPG